MIHVNVSIYDFRHYRVYDDGCELIIDNGTRGNKI
jgi:hypothetical protein